MARLRHSVAESDLVRTTSEFARSVAYPIATIQSSPGTHNHRVAIYEVDGAAGVFVDDIRGSLRTPEGVDVVTDETIYVTSASRHNVRHGFARECSSRVRPSGARFETKDAIGKAACGLAMRAPEVTGFR